MKRYIRSNDSIVDYRGYELHHQYDDKYMVCDNNSNYISDEPMSISECESYVDDLLHYEDSRFHEEFTEWSEGKIRYHEYNYGVDSYKNHKHKYKYSGPICLGDSRIDLYEATTICSSKAKAINNIKYNLSREHGNFPIRDIVIYDEYLKLLT